MDAGRGSNSVVRFAWGAAATRPSSATRRAENGHRDRQDTLSLRSGSGTALLASRRAGDLLPESTVIICEPSGHAENSFGGAERDDSGRAKLLIGATCRG